MRAIATGLQGAFATRAFAPAVATLSRMDLDELNAFRIKRLEAAVDAFRGNKNALGKALGYTDGAFVRQMLNGTRPITEKTVAAIEALENMGGWFTPPPADDEPLDLTPEERAWVLAHRAIKTSASNPYQQPLDEKPGLRRKKKPPPPKKKGEA